MLLLNMAIEIVSFPMKKSGYDLIIPRNAYNMAKIRGTVRGTEGGTVRGGDQKSWCLTAQKLGHLVLGIAH